MENYDSIILKVEIVEMKDILSFIVVVAITLVAI